MQRTLVIIGGLVLGLGLSGILSAIPAFQNAAPPLPISCGGFGLGIGLILAAFLGRKEAQ